MKTYAFMDLIGTRDALAAGKAEELLKQFWDFAEFWANHSEVHTDVRRVPTTCSNGQESPDVQVVTVSDSLLLSTVDECELTSFFGLAEHLQTYLETKVGARFYCIISRGSEVHRPDVGNVTYQSSVEHVHYRHLAGAGTAWADMMEADNKVQHHKDWRDRYKLYALGIDERELPQTVVKADETTIISKWGGATVRVLALLPA